MDHLANRQNNPVNKVMIQNLSSNNYLIGSIEKYNVQTTNISTNSTIITYPITNKTAYSNSTISKSNSTLNNLNKGLSALGITKSVNLFGFNIPQYALMIIALIFWFMILFISENEIPVIIGLAVMWIVGLWAIDVLMVAIAITIAYGVYEIYEHVLKGD